MTPVIQPVDYAKVLEIRQRVMYPDLSIDEMRLPADPEGEHLALWVGERPVSIVSVFRSDGVWQFRKLATEPDAQGRGYASLLLRHVLEQAHRNGATRLWCNARLSATALYRRMGMREEGAVWEKNGIEFVIMALSINQQQMEIIPAIDIIDGKCVRLTQGDYAQKKIYNEDPLEVALRFQDAGLRRLHLVDLDGAKAKQVQNWKVLENLAGRTSLTIDFGGGISRSEDVRIVFESGAAFATVGSVAVKAPEELGNWLSQFGAARFLLGADVKEKKIAIHGWTETSELEVISFLGQFKDKGIQQFFCTDIAKDGKLEGPSLDLYEEIVAAHPDIYFIASGGVSSIHDLEKLAEIPCSAAIVGKAIYENRIRLEDLQKFN